MDYTLHGSFLLCKWLYSCTSTDYKNIISYDKVDVHENNHLSLVLNYKRVENERHIILIPYMW